jgi:hypothetical protein
LNAILPEDARFAIPRYTEPLSAAGNSGLRKVGDGGEFRAPMAIAVIGGLLVSTVLSLVFVPSFFTVMDDIGNLVWRIFGRFIGPTDEPPEHPPAHAPRTHPTPAE